MTEDPRKQEHRQDNATTAYDRILKRLLADLETAEIKSWDYLQERIEEAPILPLHCRRVSIIVVSRPSVRC